MYRPSAACAPPHITCVPLSITENKVCGTLVNKRSRVVPAVIESTGGLSPPLRAQMRCLEGRAKGTGASDRTKYGSTRASARSFMVHHTQRISLAAVKYDALAIRKKMLSKKQKLAAHAAPTDGAWA